MGCISVFTPTVTWTRTSWAWAGSEVWGGAQCRRPLEGGAGTVAAGSRPLPRGRGTSQDLRSGLPRGPRSPGVWSPGTTCLTLQGCPCWGCSAVKRRSYKAESQPGGPDPAEERLGGRSEVRAASTRSPPPPAGTVMVCIVVGARKLGVNPDNIATPIAASLGDLITLSLLAVVSSFFYRHRGAPEA